MSTDWSANAVIGIKITNDELESLTTEKEVRVSDEYPDYKFHPETGKPLTKTVRTRVDLDDAIKDLPMLEIASDTDAMNSYVGVIAYADYDESKCNGIPDFNLLRREIDILLARIGLSDRPIQLHAVLHCSY